MGRYSDALISVGLGLINALISAVPGDPGQAQARPAPAARPGAGVASSATAREVEVAPEEVVRGDVLRVRAGDQIVVDGPLLRRAPVEADESLLTGESDPVVKDPGDELRSGSLCVAGEGHQLARDVGAASYAGRLTAEARRATTDATPLQRRITFVVRLVIALTVLMSGAILAQALLEGSRCCASCRSRRCCPGWCPTACSSSSPSPTPRAPRRIAGSGALVQQVNAVESVSNVDVVCTDKTGTLTTGRLTLDEVEPVGDRPADARRRSARSPQRHHPEPHHRGAGRGAARRRRGPSATRCRSPRRCAGPASSPTRDVGARRPRGPRAAPAAAAPRDAVDRPHGRRPARARPRPRRRPVRRAARRRRPPAPCPRWSRSRSSRSPTSCAPRSPRRSPGSARTASRSRCSPATTRAPSPRSPPRPASTSGEPVPGAALDGLDDAGARPARRPHHGVRPGRPRAQGTASSRPCAARATTSR